MTLLLIILSHVDTVCVCFLHTDISQNKEFYMNADVRPPFTYASLIRQVRILLVNALFAAYNPHYPFDLENRTFNIPLPAS